MIFAFKSRSITANETENLLWRFEFSTFPMCRWIKVLELERKLIRHSSFSFTILTHNSHQKSITLTSNSIDGEAKTTTKIFFNICSRILRISLVSLRATFSSRLRKSIKTKTNFDVLWRHLPSGIPAQICEFCRPLYLLEQFRKQQRFLMSKLL